MESEINCSFCGKSDDEVFHLIAGPNAYICDECIDLSHAIVANSRRTQNEEHNERS